ncbi:hypothetical protein STCU_01243 [Strigomonas culicis]|nr:hypothetical protein STCU_01243 [Strigomonas culicis]|eukprot:EPY35114.1 hypothetical protein STCU_01243 [Strigomonas culicis]
MMSWSIAQSVNLIFLPYVTFVDHLIIYRDGRDGRRRVDEQYMPTAATADTHQGAPSSFLSALRKKLPFFPSKESAAEQKEEVKHIMGHYYRFENDKTFDFTEYVTCAKKDSIRKILVDLPDVMRYGFMFWSLNWLPLFYYVPGHFRLAYSQAVQVVWSGIMSHLLHRGGARLRADMQTLDMKQYTGAYARATIR